MVIVTGNDEEPSPKQVAWLLSIFTILIDVERIADRLEAGVAKMILVMPAPATFDPQTDGASLTSLIIRLANELRGAQASMHRAVTIARALAAMPPN
jgi:hypothetical protein